MAEVFRVVVGTQGLDLLDFALIQSIFHAFKEAIEGNFGGVGDEAEDGVVKILVRGIQHAIGQSAAQFETLLVDRSIISA